MAPYVSDLCDITSLRPGQSASGFVFFPVPDATAVVEVIETSPYTPLAVIDPDGLVLGSDGEGVGVSPGHAESAPRPAA